MEKELKKVCSVLRALQLNEREYHRRAIEELRPAGVTVTVDMPTFNVEDAIEVHWADPYYDNSFWSNPGWKRAKKPFFNQDTYSRLFRPDVVEKVYELVAKQRILLKEVFKLNTELTWQVLKRSGFEITYSSDTQVIYFFNYGTRTI